MSLSQQPALDDVTITRITPPQGFLDMHTKRAITSQQDSQKRILAMAAVFALSAPAAILSMPIAAPILMFGIAKATLCCAMACCSGMIAFKFHEQRLHQEQLKTVNRS